MIYLLLILGVIAVLLPNDDFDKWDSDKHK